MKIEVKGTEFIFDETGLTIGGNMKELVFNILLSIIKESNLSLKSWCEFKKMIDEKYSEEIDYTTIKKRLDTGNIQSK